MGSGKNTIDILAVLQWILPIILTIPIGFAINIYTPRLQDLFAARSLTRTSKRIKVLRKELERATYYHSNMDKLFLQSAFVAFFSLFCLLAGTILSGVPALLSEAVAFAVPHVRDGFQEQGIWMPIVGGFTFFFIWLSMIIYLIAFLAVRNHMRLLSRVKDFWKYSKTVTDQIKEINKIEGKAKVGAR